MDTRAMTKTCWTALGTLVLSLSCSAHHAPPAHTARIPLEEVSEMKPVQTKKKHRKAKQKAHEEAEAVAQPGAEQRKQRKREEAERRNRLSPLRGEVARCEARIAELERRRQEIEAELANPDVYGEHAKQRLHELLKAQTQLRRDLHANPELSKLYIDITLGHTPDPGHLIRDRFGSRYAFTDSGHTDFIRNATTDDHMKVVYEDEHAVVLELNDAALVTAPES